MKTLVRIQNFIENGFNIKVIQILDKKNNNSEVFEEIGVIRFQQTPGEDNWYGLRFEVSTTESSTLQKMAELAKHVKENTVWDSQPSDVLNVIGAVEYKLFKHEFYPASAEGQDLYDVLFLGSVYTRIAASDEKEAGEILKENGWDKHDIKFNSVIKF